MSNIRNFETPYHSGNYNKNSDHGKSQEEHHAFISFIHNNVKSHKHYNCEKLPSSPFKSSSHNDKEDTSSLIKSENSEIQERQCRICLITNIDGTNDSKRKPIISPCRCSGTMKFVHTSCLTVSKNVYFLTCKF